ncbi:MAG TPA: FHA domain-containing protein [Polyangiaceae bacterium]|nr:FHA domain-containing protein [Polyangiaceae bacterium]
MSYWIRWQLGDIPLGIGTFFIGRSPAAHVVINDPRVSRSHASLTLDESGMVLRDLNSQNGVYLNGRRTTESPIVPGDRILIGGQELELVEFVGDRDRHNRVTRRELSTTQRLQHQQQIEGASPSSPLVPEAEPEPDPEPDSGLSTRRADPIELLATVAEKTLSMGRPADAERMMRSHMKNALQAARQGIPFSPERAERVAALALRLAQALRKAEWVNYVFDLYTVLKMPAPASVVETLYTLVRQVPDVNLAALRQYIQILRGRVSELGPAERFMVQRIEGLERLVASI